MNETLTQIRLSDLLGMQDRLARWKRAVEGLTPSGSEFADDPEACAAFIRRRCDWPKQILEAKRLLGEALDRREREYGPCMHFIVDPADCSWCRIRAFLGRSE